MKTSYLLYIFILISNSIMATDEPDFNLILKEDKFEIREYSSKIIAQVEVFGDFDDASSKGFKILADYIFGNNTSADGNSRIEMTAPVEMEPLPQKINMTKPVLTEGNDNTWIVSFIMPNEFTLETLPEPNNKNIKISSIPKEKYAVIIFSGLVRESSYLEKEKLLNQFIEEKKLKASGEIKIARYNPPWTLPFFRRNELMLKVN